MAYQQHHGDEIEDPHEHRGHVEELFSGETECDLFRADSVPYRRDGKFYKFTIYSQYRPK